MIKLLLIGSLLLPNWSLFARDNFTATGYCLQGKTASGQMVRNGIIAADPNVLPLGTRVHISNSGMFDGVYLVADTGSKIKGSRIDIWTASCKKAINFGKKKIRVRIIK